MMIINLEKLPPQETLNEQRDDLFFNSGICLVQVYDYQKCYEESDQIVREFLERLKEA